MSLSHVLMWSDKYGYQPVTEYDAARDCPYTVSARSKIFVCGICGQGVTFTAGRERIRHFRHDQAAQNKDCEDRSQTYGYNLPFSSFSARICTLPLRLRTEGPGRWRLELGLLALQKAVLEGCTRKLLCIENDRGETYRYNLKDRLQPDRLTWLDAGDYPSKIFRLSLDDHSALPSLWPQSADGLADVTLFEAETGRRLPFFPDVQVNREYIAVFRERFDPGYCFNVRVTLIPRSVHGWFNCDVYRVKTLSFSREAASFFLRLRANLKRQAPLIFPLWPVVIRTPHLIYHNADELFIFLEGENVSVQSFPRVPLPEIVHRDSARLIRFACGIRKQLVSGTSDAPLLQLGRFSHVLRYDYFIRQPLDRATSPPGVTVTDHKGNELKGDLLEGVRPGTLLYVRGPFDGEVWLKSEDSPLTERYTLKGGEVLELKAGMGQTLTIFQGLDSMRTIVFVRPGQTGESTEGREQPKSDDASGWTDMQLCRRLKRMHGDEEEASRALAECLRFFRGWRLVEAWLRQRQSEGTVSRRAQILLCRVMEAKGKR
ncbi:hypothetical protein [uncultured Mailhella sp.]|uniref:hypothetical protein n=1 Tax=uncultured Mailhella sp. TaxID=1981031 RepID=UPI0025E348DF|nr:hypothetical protein [uncultured Mailhella sp.]